MEAIKALSKLPDQVMKVLSQDNHIQAIAEKYYRCNNWLFLGRKYGYPIAMEGALKQKEISYIHAEGYAAGEMKHGPIALINPEMPTVAIVPMDSMYEKMESNIQEIKSRRGPVIAIKIGGEDAIQAVRRITGYTEPSTAEKGTIRGDYGADSLMKSTNEGRACENLIHASGNQEEAKLELDLWFPR